MSDSSEPDDPDDSDEPRRTRLLLLQVLAFAAIYLIWGSTYLGIRIAVRTLPPFLMAGCRFLIAGGTLYAILRARGVGAPAAGQWVRAAVAGFLMLALGNGLVTWAEQRVPSNIAALMIAAVPSFVALLDWLRPGGRRPLRRTFIGIALGAVGMALLVANRGDPGSVGAAGAGSMAGSSAGILGVVALLSSALAWAVGSLYARYGALHPHPLMAAAQQMIAGGMVLLLLAIARGEPGALSPSVFTVTGVAAFAYLTVFGSLVAFSAFGWLIKVSTPARLSTTAYVNPMVAVLLGWLVLGETLPSMALAGAGLIVCAVVVMTVHLPSSWSRPGGGESAFQQRRSRLVRSPRE